MARSSLKNVMRLIDEVKESLPVEQSFLADLKRSIEVTEKKNQRKPSETYKPSSMQCIRSMFYQRVGKDQDESNASYVLTGICNSGTDIHIRIQTAISEMRENGMDCDWIDVADFVTMRSLDDLEIVSHNGMETKLFHKKLNMSFMCDGIIRYKNHYYIVELKTESGGKFFSRKDVDPKHYHQGIAYSIAFELDEVLFIYISRDTLDMKSFMFNVSGEMKQELIGLIENCEEYVKILSVPPIPENIDRRVCQYCGYQKRCRNDK